MPRAAATLEQARAAKAAAHEQFSRPASVAGVAITRIAGGYVRDEPLGGVALPQLVGGVPVRMRSRVKPPAA